MVNAFGGTEPPENDEALRSYVKARDAVADLLRETRKVLSPLSGADSGAETLLAQLAEDRFNLVVLGEWKRGKSSLVNAILGRALLPTAAVPLTSVVTAVRYGPVERAAILRSGRRFPERIPVDALRDFVTERGNPHNLKGVASAEVEAPAAFLKRGLHLVDTPGVGSVHSESEAVTRAFLPSADAAVFVTSAEAPLSRSELTFLDTVRSHVRKVFFVVNKMDAVDPAERAQALRFVETTLANRLGVEKPLVFPLSARAALEAKVSGEATALAASGLPALESALAEFLGRERRRVFLAAVLDRALRLLDAGRFALELRRTHEGPVDEASGADLARRLEAVESARRDALRTAGAERADWERQVLEPALGRFAAAALDELRREMPGPEAFGRLDGEAYAGRLARWGRHSLAEGCAAWEAEHRASIDAVARGLCDRLGAALVATVAEVGRAAAETLGIAPPAGAAAEDASWTRPAPPFVPSSADASAADVNPCEAPLLLPGPAVLGRYVARWLAKRALPSEVKRAAEGMRQRAHGHLEAGVRAMDVASARAMAQERERLGLSGRPATRTVAALGAAAEAELARADELARRLTRLRDAILVAPDGRASSDAVAEAVAVAQATLPRTPTERAPSPRPRDWARSRTCPICVHVLDALFDFLSQFQYALATDPQTQAEFRNAGGFCPLHAWQLEELSSPRGVCGGYPGLLDSTGARARALASRPPEEASRLVREMVTRPEGCEACRVRGRAEEEAMAALGADLATEAGRGRYERSRGLCLGHLALLLPKAEPGAVPTLVRHLGRRCEDVSEALRGYALKFDAHRQQVLSGEEQAAYRQAVALVVGERRVF